MLFIKVMFQWKICYVLFMCLMCSVASATLVQMRVVKETANYGNFGQNFGETESNSQLVASVPPANFSGPDLMRRLVGKCFNLTVERYKYVFCPFQNITQYELSARWNAYHGILGIWSHWNIENNTFTSMVYNHGDRCGDIDRSVKVILQCGEHEQLSNVTEPSRCQYSAIFSTRYACHTDALIVYPRLEPKLQKEWDKLFTEFHYGYITEKGYKSGLERIFRLAGFSEVPTTKSPDIVTTQHALGIRNTFSDLLSCNKEYRNLQTEISDLNEELEALKLLLDLNKIQSRTLKPQR